MFSALFFGALALVTGAIGYDVSHMSGVFRGGRWVDGPVWRQIALGSALVLLGVHWARQLAGRGWTPVRTRRARTIKYVGRGTTARAEPSQERRLPTAQPDRSRET